jgi:hypothetical protein
MVAKDFDALRLGGRKASAAGGHYLASTSVHQDIIATTAQEADF